MRGRQYQSGPDEAIYRVRTSYPDGYEYITGPYSTLGAARAARSRLRNQFGQANRTVEVANPVWDEVPDN